MNKAYMKAQLKALALLSVVCVLMASTCKKDELSITADVQLESPFEIPLNGKVSIDSENIELRLNEITDVRCPADVQCFWAGNAKVNLSIITSGTGKELSLCIGQCDARYQKADTVQVEYQNKPYNLILTEVKPYPGTGSGQKSAVFILEKK